MQAKFSHAQDKTEQAQKDVDRKEEEITRLKLEARQLRLERIPQPVNLRGQFINNHNYLSGVIERCY